jgi:hypothetical protein
MSKKDHHFSALKTSIKHLLELYHLLLAMELSLSGTRPCMQKYSGPSMKVAC